MIDFLLVNLNFALFLWVTLNFFVMAAVIGSTRNGKLKHCLVFFLIALGIASAMRMLTGSLVGVLTPAGLGVAVASIVLTAQFVLIRFWWKTYGRKN